MKCKICTFILSFRGIFNMLVEFQLEHSDDGTYNGEEKVFLLFFIQVFLFNQKKQEEAVIKFHSDLYM